MKISGLVYDNLKDKMKNKKKEENNGERKDEME